MDSMALNQSWGGVGSQKRGLESLGFCINRAVQLPARWRAHPRHEEVGGRRREGDMATNCTPLWGQGEACNSPGSELPWFVASSETRLGHHDPDPETWHMNFRMFSCPEQSDPIQALRKLTELCHLWLRPDLHTKEQILDMLVMEQFMISMPQELQVLVMMNGVRSCKELEDLLRNNRRSKKWSVVTLLGKEYLMLDSDAEMAEAPASVRDDLRDVSSQWVSSVNDMHPGEGQASRELQTLPRVPALSRGQGEDFLQPETTDIKGNPKSPGPKQNLEKDLKENSKENPGLTFLEPQLPKGHTDVVRAKKGTEPPKRASVENVEGDTASACAVETEASPHSEDRGDSLNPRGPERSKPDATSISQEEPQGGATPVGNRESPGQAGMNPVHSPGPADAGSHPDGQESWALPPFACDVCSKRFKYYGKLVIHQRSHTGERRFQCHLCEKRFMQLSDLRVHQRTHTGEKPYMCDVCQKRFTRTFSLKCHKRSHTGEKPYECKVCKRVFTYRKNLKQHQRIHSGEKPYTCSKCPRAFGRPETLKRHQKTHRKTTSQLECTGMLTARCSLDLPGSSNSAVLATGVVGIEEHTTPRQDEFCHLAQPGLELLSSSDVPALAPRSAITGKFSGQHGVPIDALPTQHSVSPPASAAERALVPSVSLPGHIILTPQTPWRPSGLALGVVYPVGLDKGLMMSIHHRSIMGETGFHYVAQASHKVLSSSDLPPLAFQSAAIIGVNQHTWTRIVFYGWTTVTREVGDS
ncbi:Zinc finger and SCAN domain-containing protein 5A [Plecturocebus cupreus]